MSLEDEIIKLTAEIRKLNINFSKILSDYKTDKNITNENLTYTINEFCKKMNMSKALFYKLKRDNKDFIKIIKIGNRSLISHDEANKFIKKIQG